MCTKNELHEILTGVAVETKEILKERLSSVILFGSYARGDFDDESDIDIMILADISQGDVTTVTRKIRSKVYALETEKNCVLSLCVVPAELFERYKEASPFYRNVLKDGVKIAV